MALKLPSLMNKDKKRTGTTPSAPVATAYGAKSPGSFLGKLFGRDKKMSSASAHATGKGLDAGAGPTTGTGGTTGTQSRKITADVAAAKVTKTTVKSGGFNLPLIGDRPIEQQLPILLGVAALFGALTIGAIFLDARNRNNISTFTNITSQLQYHSQRLAKSAGLSARGDLASFPQLQDSRDQFDIFLKVLNEGGEVFNTTVPSAKISEELTSRLAELSKRFMDASPAEAA